MLNYFARLGKNPWAKLVMPGLFQMYALGYLTFQQYGHSIATNLFAAQSSSGKREEISEELQKMCMETFNDLKDDFNKPMLENSLLQFDPSPIKWFMVASFEPMVFGMTETKTGLLIGLPSHYNYTREDEIPESIFEIKKYKLFKNPLASKDKKAEEGDEKIEEEVTLSDENRGNEGQHLVTIDRESQAGQDFITSLLLSEKAKKYSIAKQLHRGDSYRAGFHSLFIIVNGLLSVFIARGAVAYFNLAKAHLSHRIPYYILSGTLFVGNQNYIGASIDSNCENKAENRTLALGQMYIDGAEEYKQKEELRNKVLSSYLS